MIIYMHSDIGVINTYIPTKGVMLGAVQSNRWICLGGFGANYEPRARCHMGVPGSQYPVTDASTGDNRCNRGKPTKEKNPARCEGVPRDTGIVLMILSQLNESKLGF